MQKIKVCQRGIERSMLNIKLRQKVRANEIRSKTKLIDAVDHVLKMKWHWAGHVARMSDETRWTKILTFWKPQVGKRKRGRQKRRWEDDIVSTAGKNWMEVALDRQKWKTLEKTYLKRYKENVEGGQGHMDL